MSKRFQNLVGEKFGRLTVVSRAENRGKETMWNCACLCGNTVRVWAGALKSGNTTSCGCVHSEQLAKRNKENAIHSGSNERLFGIWTGMKTRCYNSHICNYKDYGGRGITVCEDWRNDYAAFRDWAMANGYDENALYGECTIDRIDNDKGYSPDNCRWVSMKEQSVNKRTAVIVEIDGEIKPLKEWCSIFKISYSCVMHRIHNLNWSIEKAIKTPYLRNRKRISVCL